jgi:hypothetical protein
VTDIPAEFVADPFLLQDNKQWYLFFEVFDKSSGKGEIGLATSKDHNKWEYERIVLNEEFHLSYPYVFKEDGTYYMLPECGTSGYVNLYKATDFPFHWERAASILRGNYSDSSIFYYKNRWWLFNTENKGNLGKNNNLHLFYSDHLTDGWKEHPRSPLIVENARIARPAGRVLVDGDRIIRFAQDDESDYGKEVTAFQITKLTTEEYEETRLGKILGGSEEPNTWNSSGMHQIDAVKTSDGSYIAAVDGQYKKNHNIALDKIKSFLSQLIPQSK